MSDPVLTRMPDAEEVGKISHKHKGKTVVGHAIKDGVTMFFFEDGTSSIEDRAGKEVKWPEV